MEPYYQDDRIQIVQFKGPTELHDVQQALAEFLGDPTATQPRFLLELQRAKFSFETDEATEFYLFADETLQHLGERQVVVIIDSVEQEREPTARLLAKLQPQLATTPNFSIVADLAAANDCFATDATSAATSADDSSAA